MRPTPPPTVPPAIVLEMLLEACLTGEEAREATLAVVTGEEAEVLVDVCSAE